MSDIPRDRRAGDDPDREAGSTPAAFPATGDATADDTTADDTPTHDTTTHDTTTHDTTTRDTTTVHAPAGDDTGRIRAGDAAGDAAAGSGTAAERQRRQRRRRRLVVTGVAVAAALVVIALCAGGLAALRSFRWISDDSREETRQIQLRRDASCLELEERLNRVAPPGSTPNPPARAVAIRNENAALRPYLAELELRSSDRGRALDAWRQLLDARTAYAEALDKQAPSRTPAFFVVPRTPDGAAVADQLTRWSPAACAGPVRRLAVPDL